jgi:single-strand DNA-binding protein
MVNESNFCVAGYVATVPVPGMTLSGVPTLQMRVAWTPRKRERGTDNWADEPACFATVKCYRKLAENALMSVHKGEPVLVTGSLRIREYDAKDGSRRTNVDVTATSIGHDLTRGIASFHRLPKAAETPAAENADDHPEWAKSVLARATGTAQDEVAAAGEASGELAGEASGELAGETAGEPVAAPF